MDAKDIRNLHEAYMQVYQELDEATRMRKEFRAQTGDDAAAAKKETRVRQSMAIKSGGKSSEYPGTVRKDVSVRRPATRILRPGSGDLTAYNLQRARKFAAKNEEYDIYDVILSHLLDEGYAESEEAAEVIMVNMSEDWYHQILNEMPWQVVRNTEGKRKIKIGKPVQSRSYAERKATELTDYNRTAGTRDTYGHEYVP